MDKYVVYKGQEISIKLLLTIIHILELAEKDINEGKDVDISPLKLQMLLYFTYGINLVENNETLFPDDFYAWDRGPTIPSVFYIFKSYRYFNIDTKKEIKEIKKIIKNS